MRMLVCQACQRVFEDRWRKRPKCCSRQCSNATRKPKTTSMCRVGECRLRITNAQGLCGKHYRQAAYRRYYPKGKWAITPEEKAGIILRYELQFKTKVAIAREMGINVKRVQQIVRTRNLERVGISCQSGHPHPAH